jgi:hypothetical protein
MFTLFSFFMAFSFSVETTALSVTTDDTVCVYYEPGSDDVPPPPPPAN